MVCLILLGDGCKNSIMGANLKSMGAFLKKRVQKSLFCNKSWMSISLELFQRRLNDENKLCMGT